MNCKNCKYYETFCDDETRSHRLKTLPDDECKTCTVKEANCIEGCSGFCHRFPPSDRGNDEDRSNTNEVYIAITTFEDNWCGEFINKNV
jgi:hypothetical protein